MKDGVVIPEISILELWEGKSVMNFYHDYNNRGRQKVREKENTTQKRFEGLNTRKPNNLKIRSLAPCIVPILVLLILLIIVLPISRSADLRARKAQSSKIHVELNNKKSIIVS